MSSSSDRSHIGSVHPLWAVEGGRISLTGEAFPIEAGLPEVWLDTVQARVVYASATRLSVVVPEGLPGGRTQVRVEGIPGESVFVDIASVVATGLHQVDNPVLDNEGNLYVTYSGSRGEQTPVSIFRVRGDGVREPFVSGVVNATSMAVDRQGRLYVSSRFDGMVYRLTPSGEAEPIASDLGIACGLAFGPDDALYVGDRSGTIFRIDASARTTALTMLPPSVAAFHLAFGPDDHLYVTGPTLSSYDYVYRVDLSGQVEVFHEGFGRPQGLAFDSRGDLFVIEALVGSSGVYRVSRDHQAECLLSAPSLIGLAFHPQGGLIVTSNETAYRVEADLRPAGMSTRVSVS